MRELQSTWRRGRLEATAYDFVIEREPLARAVGHLVWGIDTRRFFDELSRLSDLPDGASVLDLPCGGGVAFRGLRAGQDVDYVAADISPVMLQRAAAEAGRRGVRPQLLEADVESLPFADGRFDLVITYTGLHCFPDPGAAIAELARVIRPGGELRGSTLLRGRGRRFDAVIRLGALAGVFGPGLAASELEASLAAAGLAEVSVSPRGALAFFSARA